MILIACLDDLNGIMFNNRRQSKDKLLIEELIATTDNHPILVDFYSANLFKEYEDRIIIVENPFAEAKQGDYCFIEGQTITDSEDIEQIIIYRWNRVYPADKWFDINISAPGSHFTLLSETEFQGNSHDTITKEVYVR